MRQIFSLPTAKDAVIQSKTNYNENVKNAIEQKIQNAISKGDNLIVYCAYELENNPILVQGLRDLGYKVGERDVNSSYISISWFSK